MKLFFFDTETTGLNSDDQILQFGGIYGSFDGKKFYEERRINQYINVTKDIHPNAENIHGINKQLICKFSYIDEYMDEFLGLIRKTDYVVGHNVDFDIKMLKQECIRLGIVFDWDDLKTICTMKKSIDLVNGPGGKRPKLSELYRYLFKKDFDYEHNAIADIEATKDCFLALVESGDIHFDIDNLDYCQEMMVKNNKCTDLLCASSEGHKEIVEMLLKSGANMEIQTKEGNTVLMYASSEGNKEIVEMLLKSGANVEAQTKDGITALMCASDKGHKEIVEMLLKYGANVEVQTKNGITALWFAKKKSYEEIAMLLFGTKFGKASFENIKNIVGDVSKMDHTELSYFLDLRTMQWKKEDNEKIVNFENEIIEIDREKLKERTHSRQNHENFWVEKLQSTIIEYLFGDYHRYPTGKEIIEHTGLPAERLITAMEILLYGKSDNHFKNGNMFDREGYDMYGHDKNGYNRDGNKPY